MAVTLSVKLAAFFRENVHFCKKTHKISDFCKFCLIYEDFLDLTSMFL